MSGSNTLIGGGAGALAVTGLGLPIGWYFVVGVSLLVIGFIAIRMVMRRNRRHGDGSVAAQ